MKFDDDVIRIDSVIEFLKLLLQSIDWISHSARSKLLEIEKKLFSFGVTKIERMTLEWDEILVNKHFNDMWVRNSLSYSEVVLM